MTTDKGRPDAGPERPNERAGATAVGVRFPLVAFNVNLGTSDVAVAQRIADAVRHVRGGYRHIKAMDSPWGPRVRCRSP